MADDATTPASQQDIGQANVARMYDYLLGGSKNLSADRELADHVIAADPGTVRAARELRSFVRRAVLACLDAGIEQFLDLGSGIPTAGNVHEVARERVPDARVAYVEVEPVAVSHAEEILGDVDGVTITHADIRDAAAVLSAPTVTEVIDFERPVAVLMLAVLHFLPGDIRPLLAAYRHPLVAGSAMAISHGSFDWDDPEVVAAQRRRAELYGGSGQPPTIRDRAGIAALFGGLELAEPGLVDIVTWRPDTGLPPEPSAHYGGVGFLL